MPPPLRPWDHTWAEQQMEPCSLAGSPGMLLIPARGFAPATKSQLESDLQPFSLLPGQGSAHKVPLFSLKTDRCLSLKEGNGDYEGFCHMSLYWGEAKEDFSKCCGWCYLYMGNSLLVISRAFATSWTSLSLEKSILWAAIWPCPLFLFSKIFYSQKCKLLVCLFASKRI